MNSRGTAGGNWRWRLRYGELTTALEERLLDSTRTYGRDVAPAQEKTE